MSFENIPAYNWLSCRATVADLPASGNSPGDARVVLSNSNIYVWDGTAWQNSTGDIGSIGTSTDNAIVRWDGGSGNTVQNSGVIVDDSNNMSGVATLHVGGSGNSVASAILELTSTTKGFLPPSMTTTQRDAIPTPATGLIIYNATTGALNIFAGGVWGAIGGGGSGITDLTGEVTATGPGSAVATVSNAAVIGKVLTGYVSGAGTVAASDTILQAIQKLNGNTALKLDTSAFTDTAVTGKVLTGYTSGAGTVASTDTILQAIQKLNGNTAVLGSRANLTSSTTGLTVTGGTSAVLGSGTSLAISGLPLTALAAGTANRVMVTDGSGNATVSTTLMQNGNGIAATGTDFRLGLSSNPTNSGFIIQTATINTGNNLIDGSSNTFYLGAYASGLSPFNRGYFGSGGVVIGVTSGALFTPNYHFNLRQPTAATAIYQQWCITTTTGTTSTDGTKVGLDAAGIFEINQQENLAIKFYTNALERFQIKADGVLANKASANESTGAGAALLGTNSPATTLSAPYTWLKVETSDGSTGYIPIWK